MKAVVAAGGKGTRLSSIANDIPKPMVPIAGKPILEYQIDCLRENGIKDIFILVGHLGSVIKGYFKDGSDLGVRIQYIEEKEPLGSAGSLFFLRNELNDDFVFLFGDLMFDVYLERMIKFHKEKKAMVTLMSHPNSHPFDSDLIINDSNDLVTGIDSKHNIRNYSYHNLVNSGVYVISNRIFEKYFKEPKMIDFEKDVVNVELYNGTVYSYHSTEYVKDVGTPDRYNSVCNDIENGIVAAKNLRNLQKCIFLDRDGTINKYVGFVRTPSQIELENGSVSGLKEINRSEFLSVVITNQPVVARGEATFKRLEEINNKIETLLGEKGAYFDDLFFCPHHPNKGFEGEIPELKCDCDCRKPKIGLLLQAKEKYNIDLAKSYFVGDTTTDIQTGINAGMKTVLVKTGEKGNDSKFAVKADFVIDSLAGIKDIIGGKDK